MKKLTLFGGTHRCNIWYWQRSKHLCAARSLLTLTTKLAQTLGHFRARRGILLEVYLDSLRIRFTYSDWKDFSFGCKEELIIQGLDLYIHVRTENTDSTILVSVYIYL